MQKMPRIWVGFVYGHNKGVEGKSTIIKIYVDKK
jgi:hypothetical protein